MHPDVTVEIWLERIKPLFLPLHHFSYSETGFCDGQSTDYVGTGMNRRGVASTTREKKVHENVVDESHH